MSKEFLVLMGQELIKDYDVEGNEIDEVKVFPTQKAANDEASELVLQLDPDVKVRVVQLLTTYELKEVLETKVTHHK